MPLLFFNDKLNPGCLEISLGGAAKSTLQRRCDRAG